MQSAKDDRSEPRNAKLPRPTILRRARRYNRASATIYNSRRIVLRDGWSILTLVNSLQAAHRTRVDWHGGGGGWPSGVFLLRFGAQDSNHQEGPA